MSPEINPSATVRKIRLRGSPIYEIDDFYSNPDELLAILDSAPPARWKEDQKPSNNGVYFDDMRHNLGLDGLSAVYKSISSLVGQPPASNRFLTNLTRFRGKEQNPFETHYWWPHLDEGYTAIVYLNKADVKCGTNLYDPADVDKALNKLLSEPEHLDPWQPKDEWSLLCSLEPKFNRLIAFNARLFWHGMNISTDDYFSGEFRKNQVMFFSPVSGWAG